MIINRESIIESLKLEKEESIIHVHKEYSEHQNLKKLRLISKVHTCPSHVYFLTCKEEWNMNMAAMGAALPDEDLAAVLSYIRTSWGNKAAPVTADDLKKIRAEVGNGALPMTGEQMMKLPE